MTDHQCKHELCTCIIAGGNEYCSDHCREATEQDISEIKCDCGCLNCG